MSAWGWGQSRRPLDVDVALWHLGAAGGVAVVEILFAISALVTHEADAEYAVLRLLPSLVLICVLWALTRRTRHHAALIIWPLFLMVLLSAGSRATPQAAQLCLGTLVLGFALLGLTQPRWVILVMLVPASLACEIDTAAGVT